MQQQDTDQSGALEWRDGVPVSTRFDDPYYSLQDGMAETQHVFLQGNDLPDRFCDGFHIAELGFGTGLNLLVALSAFRAHNTPGVLRYTGFEAYPIPFEDLMIALAPFRDRLPEDAVAAVLHMAETRGHTLDLPDLHAGIVVGDARDMLPAWEGSADAWFLDGFAPSRNPELWSDTLMFEVARHTRPGGSFATYTAAGAVRRALAEAGFDVERIPGFGRKRHMSRGRLPTDG